ncbi:FAD-dependent oxidoreductase [Actinocrinis sp.]|uniref:FAD-dependent oxidoreductase n=1 Tax=Actinocrinis sp. TaxID=1920516 RepID=UPI002D6E6F58|nr:FAD-dependent oxidoreductase [Actinocrinis sp.]HZP52285.1 FAD-dependent oxidoreductase [Actinocrinis sp.]
MNATECPSLPASAQVVVVGAGPVGLTTAIALASHGVDVVVLDRQAEAANTSRAAVVHARTLEVLEELEVTDRLRRLGLEMTTFAMRDGGRTLVRVSFDALPTRHPYTLMIPQDVTEAVLLDRLLELGGAVHRPYELVRAVDDGVAVEVTAKSGTGEEYVVRASYVVGADGMNSTVRDLVGIEFEGGTYAESFVLADVRLEPQPAREDGVVLSFRPSGTTVIAPLPGERHRVIAGVDEAPSAPDLATVQALVDRWAGESRRRAAPQVTELIWSSRFRVHHRVAERYRAGRVLLAGDAAHVHSPAGGQGMNIGMQDGVALAAALAAALDAERRGDTAAASAALDGYEAARRPAALRVVSLTDRMTRMAMLRGPVPRAARNTLLKIVDCIPPIRNKVAAQIAGLAD